MGRIGQVENSVGLVTEVYDQKWGSEWGDMNAYGPFSRHLRRLILSLLHRLTFDSVLDVGCGQGCLLAAIRKLFPEVKLHGADFSRVAIETARKRLPEAHFSVMDVSKEAPAGKYDLVLCCEVLEHVTDDLGVIRRLREATERYCLVTTVQGRMRPAERHVGHVRNYARGELVEKIREAGFQPVKVIEWGFPFYSPLYRNFLNLCGQRVTSGRMGISRRAAAELVYWLFFLNSARRGDEIIVLAE
ncbi:MAG: class I SAM-dependent methyltransferase [Kiritimatiellae bacterium]|nr:class I SAM-dependent methyltransferase [Kiritimatiellia bacterium]